MPRSADFTSEAAFLQGSATGPGPKPGNMLHCPNREHGRRDVEDSLSRARTVA